MTIKVYNVDNYRSYIYENVGIYDGVDDFDVFDLDTGSVLVSCCYSLYNWEEVKEK